MVFTQLYRLMPQTAVIILLMIIALTTNASSQPIPQRPPLFAELPQGEIPDEAKRIHKSSDAAERNYESTVLRSSYIRVDWDQMIELAKTLKPLLLPLFKDHKIEFLPSRFQKIPPNPKFQAQKERFRWSGKVRVEGHTVGNVNFVVNLTDRVFSGTIRFQNKAFHIRPLSNNRYEVTELKLPGFPEEARPIRRKPSVQPSTNPTSENPLDPDRTIRHDTDPEQPSPGGIDNPGLGPSPTPTEESSCTIDVMVLYTNAAKAAASDIEGEIYEALSWTNITFENSKGAAVVQPTYIGLFDFPEDEFYTIGDALNEIGNEATKLGQSVKNLREEWKADVVSLWVESTGKGEDKCGIGYMADSEHLSDIDAFTVVRRDCATGYLSFTHEIGHNLGLNHDRYSEHTRDKNDGLGNYGHLSYQDKQRTMMATNEECWDTSKDVCDRIPFFSSPDFTYPDSNTRQPMGIGMGKGNSADNAFVFRRTGCKVANYR